MIVLDAGVVIAIASAADLFHAVAVRTLTEARQARKDLVLPVTAYSEALVWPTRQGKAELVDRFVDEAPLRLVSVDRPIAQAAASLRARHSSLRLPDALVLATAEVMGAHEVLTTDEAWRRVAPRVRVLIA